MYWICVAVVLSVAVGCSAADWRQDFARQPLADRPQLEVRYTDGTRTAFEIVAEDYHLVGGLRTPHSLRDAVTGDEWLSFTVLGKDGKTYSSRHAGQKSRINLYRRGPYFCEVHWLDVQVAERDGGSTPLKGDVALYCYPDKILASITWHATADFDTAGFVAEGRGQSEFTPEPFKAGTSQHFAFPLFGETAPLPASAFESIDAVRGCYTIGSLSNGGFQGHFYNHPNRYETVRFRVANDTTPRTVYICHENTGGDKGSVEGGVLLDEAGHPLPVVVQISKNFAGEFEEKFYNPSDAPFSETYFPLVLAANEARTLTSLHLYQNWGAHMVKQFSSLGAWMDYFHSSTGVTETTCYVPFKFAGLSGVDIADFRAMSQHAFWSSQPQHDNIAGHSFLWFHHGDDWQHLAYRGTEYRSTGPNWMDIGFAYRSTDGAIRATVDCFELPQADELRQFLHIRYDVVEPVTVGDARRNFRLLTAASWVQRLRHTRFAATGQDDVALSFEKDHFPVLGHAIPDEDSFMAVYGDPKGGNAFLLRNWNARVGQVTVGPAASVYCEASGDTRLLLVPNADTLDLQPGDYFDFEVVIIPFGSDASADAIRREAVAYGSSAPRVTAVMKGTKESDFPTIVRAEANGAEFTIQGGRDLIPVIVTGLTDYRWPRVERRGERGWQPVSHARVGQLDGVQTFCDVDGKLGAVFLVHSDDTPQAYRVTVGEEPAPGDAVRVTPLDPTGLQHAVLIQAPWMKSPIRLRFPETLHTDTLDFIDHKRDDMTPRIDPAPLAGMWNVSEGGSVWFDWTYDNQAVGGRLSPNVDSIDLEFWLENRRTNPVQMAVQFCPVLAGTLFEDRALERTWGHFDGRWRKLAEMDRGAGKFELCYYGVAGGPAFEVPLPRGRSADLLDFGMLAVTSPDGRYVFAIAWPDCARLLSNANIPCVHADPPAYAAPPGKRLHVRGKLYLMEGTLNDVLQRARREVEPLGRERISPPGNRGPAQ